MISVCMATYNGGKYLKKQLDSILFQLNDDDEIIISDDGSIDNTVEIINGFNDKRIKLLRHQKTRSIIKMQLIYIQLKILRMLLIMPMEI